MSFFLNFIALLDIKMELAREDERITLVRAALGPPDDSESDIIETVLQLESDRKSSILSNTSNPQSTSSSINLPVSAPMKLETVKIENYQAPVSKKLSYLKALQILRSSKTFELFCHQQVLFNNARDVLGSSASSTTTNRGLRM